MAAPEKERINRGEEESSEQIHHEANSDQRLADIVSFLPDPTFGIDKKGIVISWNRSMEDLTGIGAIDILGKGDYEYAVPFEGVKRPVLVDLVLNQDPKLESEYNSLQRDGMNLTDEIFLPSFGKNGSYIWAKAAPLFDNSGDIIGAVESLRDITERKRSEDRQILHLIIKDITERKRAKDVSAKVAEQFGYCQEDHQGPQRKYLDRV